MTNTHSVKVNFLVIGAMKCATTALCEALSKHPDICFPEVKEPQFFSKTDWREHLGSYHKSFEREAKLYGEGSTNYSKFPHFNPNIHKDIQEYNSNMKFIYIMRNPIERVISHYVHSFNRGYEKNTIDTAIAQRPIYIDTSRYAFQIEHYVNLFPSKNILFLFFEDFIDSPQQTLKDVCKFLEIEPISFDLSNLKKNSGRAQRIVSHELDKPRTIVGLLKKLKLRLVNKGHLSKTPQISSATRDFIIESVSKDVKEIENLTGRNLSHWLG